ncbi:unnamed protein product [Cuscuta campestris]|uniref:Uncharacterized protein n=1 Tax=Cuscuta campestris TaxID=132261 RepID=A0A484LA81_9ASTE|nr:unnamed protein product [Cuscuta campestris]
MPQIGKVVGLRKGNPSVVFTGEEEQHLAQELQYAVVGRSNISPPLNDLHRILYSIGFKAFLIKPLSSLIPKPHITSNVHPNTTPNICPELLNLMDLDPTPTLPSGSLDDTTSPEVINHDPTTTILNNLGFPLHDTNSEEELDIHCHSEGDDEPYIKGNLEPFILKPTLKCAQVSLTPRRTRKKRVFPPSGVQTRSKCRGQGALPPLIPK